MSNFCFKLDKKTDKRLKELHEQTGINLGSIVRYAIKKLHEQGFDMNG